MEPLLIMFTIVGSALFIVFTIVHGINMNFQDSLDYNKTLRAILKRIGIKPSEVHERWNGELRDIYPIFYGILWFVIYPIGCIFYLYDLTIAHIFIELDKREEQRKRYISLQDIYSFKKNDQIRMKDGDIKTLNTFTADSFSDMKNDIFPWIDAKENITATKRNDAIRRDEKFKLFEKESQEFEKRVKAFNKAMDEAKKEITA